MKYPARSIFWTAFIAPALLLPFAAEAAPQGAYANVVSATPVTALVAVPRQVCSDEQATVQPRTSGAGALIGAIAGGVLGNSMGRGFGRAAATGVGAVAGSVIGNQVEANGSPRDVTTVRQCQTVSAHENRTVGYDVVYEYAGQRYSTRLPYDPGQRLAVDIRPAVAAPAPQPGPVYDGSVYEPAPAVPIYVPVRVGTPVPVAVYVGPSYGYRYHWR